MFIHIIYCFQDISTKLLFSFHYKTTTQKHVISHELDKNNLPESIGL